MSVHIHNQARSQPDTLVSVEPPHLSSHWYLEVTLRLKWPKSFRDLLSSVSSLTLGLQDAKIHHHILLSWSGVLEIKVRSWCLCCKNFTNEIASQSLLDVISKLKSPLPITEIEKKKN